MEKQSSAFSGRAAVVLAAGLVNLNPGGTGLYAAVAFSGLTSMEAYAQSPPKAEAELDSDFLLLPSHEIEWVESPPERIAVGDALRLRIRGEGFGDDARLELPPGNSPLIEQGWHLSGKIETTDDGLQIEAVPLNGGRKALPSLTIVSEEGRRIGRTDPFVVDVQVPEGARDGGGQEDQPPELLPPLELSFPVWLALFLALIGLAVLTGFGILLRRRIRARRPKAKSPLPAAPAKPAAQVALESLERLEKLRLWEKGEHKKHYFSISETMKVYLGARFGFDAVESTTSELIDSLEATADDALVDRVESLFDRLDPVKFSDQVPHPGGPMEVLEAARKIVLDTRPVEITPGFSANPAAAGTAASRRGGR